MIDRLEREADSYEIDRSNYRAARARASGTLGALLLDSEAMPLPAVKITARFRALRRAALSFDDYDVFFPEAPDGTLIAGGPSLYEALETLLHRIDAMLAAIPAGGTAGSRI